MSEEERFPGGVELPPNQGPAEVGGVSGGGIYLPPGVDEEKPEGGIYKPGEPANDPPPDQDNLYVPPGLEEVAKLPGTGLEEAPRQPIDELTPADFAKPNCQYCHGKGGVVRDNEELRAKEMVLCICVEKRMESGMGPRSKNGRDILRRQEEWYNQHQETDVHTQESDMNRQEIEAAREAAKQQLKDTGDKSGFESAMAYLDEQEALLSDEVKVVEEAPAEAEGPRFSDKALEVIEANSLDLELFAGYEFVSVSTAQRIADEVSAAEEELSPEPEDIAILEELDDEVSEVPDDGDDEEILPEDLGF